MRYMMIFKASEESETGKPPSSEMLTAMGEVLAEMAERGVLLGGEGLRPSSSGFRLAVDEDGERRVIDGPFTETKELIAGFCLIQADSREEAMEWGWRCVAAGGSDGDPGQLEIREVSQDEDFGDDYTRAARALAAETWAKATANLKTS